MKNVHQYPSGLVPVSPGCLSVVPVTLSGFKQSTRLSGLSRYYQSLDLGKISDLLGLCTFCAALPTYCCCSSLDGFLAGLVFSSTFCFQSCCEVLLGLGDLGLTRFFRSGLSC